MQRFNINVNLYRIHSFDNFARWSNKWAESTWTNFIRSWIEVNQRSLFLKFHDIYTQTHHV